jgi:hypothetical protein
MRLSEAIRLGSLLHPQCRYSLKTEHNGNILATCAIGAACAAVGVWDSTVYDILPGLSKYAPQIMSLNDTHLWTREAIADWVEEQERDEPVTPGDLAKLNESIPEETLELISSN